MKPIQLGRRLFNRGLLKFARDRRTWLRWLFEAKKRYGLGVLNYMVTSNHIDLLVEDKGAGVIPRSIQLIAGRKAQDYNRRKKRKGAFWEDRYQATAVQAASLDPANFCCLDPHRIAFSICRWYSQLALFQKEAAILILNLIDFPYFKRISKAGKARRNNVTATSTYVRLVWG